MDIKELWNSNESEAIKIARGYNLGGIREKITKTGNSEIKKITIIRRKLLL